LHEICKNLHNIELDIETDWLIFLNDVYIDSRYPADFGILPGGQPQQKDALQALNYAKAIYEKIQPLIIEG
jgi:hypothetical protein